MFNMLGSSSGALHRQAVEEFRELDFKTFESFVIQRLAKILNLKPQLFKRNCFRIQYTTDEAKPSNYHYCILANDDRSIDGEQSWLTSCFPFINFSLKTKSLRIQLNDSDDEKIDFNFIRHVRRMHEFILREEHLCTEGIFLKAGSKDKEKQLRQAMLTSKYIDFDEFECSVHDCCNLLKHCLQQMQEPLFLSNYYLAYERVAKMVQRFQREREERQQVHQRYKLMPPDSELYLKEREIIECFQLMTHLMPYRKRGLFRWLIELLQAVCKYHHFNRMTRKILGSIFAPLVITPRGLPHVVALNVSRDMAAIITLMIKVGDECFGTPSKLCIKVWQHMLEAKDQIDELRNSISPVTYYH